MAIKQTLNSRISYRIKRSAIPVFVPDDFKDLSDDDQIGRVLRTMTRSGVLIKLGQGVYTRPKISKLTGKLTLEKSLRDLAILALIKLKVEVVPTKFEQDYIGGQSTQIPTGRVIGIKGRVKRKISYNGKSIQYEQVS